METTVKVTLPEMGESVTEGAIVEWRKRVGDWIDEGDILVEVTTDKVDVEVPSTASGVITTLFGDEGASVAVGAALAEIDPSAPKPAAGATPPAAAVAAAGATSPAAAVAAAGATSPAAAVAAAGATSPAAAVAAARATPPAATAPKSPLAAPTPKLTEQSGNGGNSKATSRALQYARVHNLEIGAVKASGPDGLISRFDVIRASLTGEAKPLAGAGLAAKAVVLPAPSAQAAITTLKGPQAALVGYMEQSLTLPTATSFRTFGVGVLEQKRAELNTALKNAGRSEKISFTHLIAYAIARAVRAMPEMTDTFRREGNLPQRVNQGLHLGLAVDTQRKDGSRFLVVPVIRQADRLNFAEFRGKYDDLVLKARENRLSADEVAGSTLTLTNPGGIGTISSVPRLMPGQGAIVAAGAIQWPPGFAQVVPATLAQLGIEKIMSLTNTYDHRVIQGAQSGEFLKRIEQLLAGAEGFYEALSSDLQLGGASPATSNVAALAAVAKPAVSNGILAATVSNGAVPAAAIPAGELLKAVASGMAIVASYRTHGHLNASLDPLGSAPVGEASLNPQSYGLTAELMAGVPADILGVKVGGSTLAEVLPNLQQTYSSTIAYEVEHIADTEQRAWLREKIESGQFRRPLSPESAERILGRLTKTETMERYLRKKFIGFKTFSIEGLDAMIPVLEEAISGLAGEQIETVVLGMAHRGRLSTIAHVVNRPYEEILAEFEEAEIRGEGNDDDVTGDVKYHHGAVGTYHTADGKDIRVILACNPSHLEAVNGVVEGRTRALQTNHSSQIATIDHTKAAAILIHGDAAFSGQGVVAEVLNMQALAGYSIGGTLHIIANNQVGFTTDPIDDRSTRYASDLAKGFDVPIIHVNADDVEAAIAAVGLANEFRRTFGHDVLIDLIGYRRFGHNETDEPAYTQPGMYDKIKAHPTVRELFARQLVARGVVTQERVDALQASATKRITEAHAAVTNGAATKKLISVPKSVASRLDTPIDTKVPQASLAAWSGELLKVGPDFTVNPKLAKQFERRKLAFDNEGEVDWSLAEALALASLVSQGIPVRLTGQDTERGTFSHRHLVLHDPKTEQVYAPIQHLSTAQASLDIYNSPLSEYACLGFEYGYAVAIANALVIWEAQFGDFNNGAQIIIDQFISAGKAKWGETSRLTLLLPHGYEGQGPEHSSARLERFLQLSAEGNLRIANCSTAAQYFHLLRAQALDPHALPLIIMAPKSLLRARPAQSKVTDLSEGHFQHIINDVRFIQKPEAVERLLLCSGKVYYDLVGHENYSKLQKTAIVRVELLAPFPVEEITALLTTYPNLKSILWVQEEPSNMGAYAQVVRRLRAHLPVTIAFDYVGRPLRSSPSEGYPGAHAEEQQRIVATALTE